MLIPLGNRLDRHAKTIRDQAALVAQKNAPEPQASPASCGGDDGRIQNNDTALLARVNPGNASDIADAFATFHSAPSGDYNQGTGNAVMMDGSIEAVTPWNDGTFKSAWPKLGGKFRN